MNDTDRAGTAAGQISPVIDPQRVAVLWIESGRAAIATWRDEPEPTIEHIERELTPKRRARGSVRRGPARPSGGGRVYGHGTKEQHEQELKEFFVDVAARLADLDTVEVSGRGYPLQAFADLLSRLAEQRKERTEIATRNVARRPTDRQLAARLRKLSGTELPRRRVGRYRLPAEEPATPTGRPLRPAAGRRTLRPARLTETKHIEEEVELMLADLPEDPE